MKLLIIGGTVFLGRHVVQAALDHGHEVTLFNRGRNNENVFPQVEKLIGDRDGNLDALKGRKWDAVIDTCGYVPRVVRQSAEYLAESVGHYTFVSTISVYDDFKEVNKDEAAPVGVLDDESTEEVQKHYGPLKALCEKVVAEVMPGRALIVRPGLIVGPFDPTDRFTYWPHRAALGGDVLAPGNPDKQVQFIDARDLAEWIVRMAEARVTGVYNATGPESKLTMKQLLDTCVASVGRDAKLNWMDEGFLLENEVGPWMELPLWIPDEGEKALPGMLSVNCGKALDQGLEFRPLAETVRDTLEWDRTRPLDRERRAGMKPEREQELLAKWLLLKSQ
jgi:2'-hydroxyisoflavone reductase